MTLLLQGYFAFIFSVSYCEDIIIYKYVMILFGLFILRHVKGLHEDFILLWEVMTLSTSQRLKMLILTKSNFKYEMALVEVDLQTLGLPCSLAQLSRYIAGLHCTVQ